MNKGLRFYIMGIGTGLCFMGVVTSDLWWTTIGLLFSLIGGVVMKNE